MHEPVVGRFVSIVAGTSYARECMDATDEYGTKTPPANAHARGRGMACSTENGQPVVVCRYEHIMML
jgi:hypothetical protein